MATRLRALGWTVELVHVRTDGDRLTGSLATIGGTGVFVTALREALLTGRCDIAVHSLKDLPTAPAAGIALAAVPERADPRDALCAFGGRRLADLPPGARVGTGSPRRAAQLRLIRPDLDVQDIRGNVDTRLGRVHDGPDGLDAVVLARAGLARIGRLDSATEVFEPATMTPAPGQGALAIECRADDAQTLAGLAALDDWPTRLAVTAERAVLARLEAGCSAPVGALAGIAADGLLHLQALAVAPAGEPFRAASIGRAATVQAAADLGSRLADDLLARGLPGAAPRPTHIPTSPRGTDA